MAGTSLKRKARKNRVVAKRRQDNIKRLSAKPVIQNVDVEAIKEEFAAKSGKGKKAEKKEEAPKAEKESKSEE